MTSNGFYNPPKQFLQVVNLYPVTIIQDRYDGTYSHAKWLAFNLDENNLPPGPSDSDGDCMYFWSKHNQKDLPIGKGATPDKALQDLVIRKSQANYL